MTDAAALVDEWEDLKSKLRDRWWRLNNLYYIVTKEGRKELFRPNWAQEQLYREMHFLNLILKARQLGFTTFIDIFILDYCLFNSDVAAGIIAHTREDAETIFENKIKFAFDNLPEPIRARRLATQDSARQLRFNNGSSIRVGTSMRSGTLQILHVSEHGKICAKFPDKAKEIRTGALNAVEAGQFIFIESTAEGQNGDFYKLSKGAEDKAKVGAVLTPMDFKFHFYPWHANPGYRLKPDGVAIPAELQRYFAELERDHGIALDSAQKAWYVKKFEVQQEEMWREFPSFPDEAFKAAIEGAYFAKQMSRARREKRVCRIPYEPSVPVNTFWDLGMDDSTSIWVHQRVGKENRFLAYYSNSGESLAHYAGWLHGLDYHVWGKHFLPHDAAVKELGAIGEDGRPRSREETLKVLGIKPTVICPRTEDVLTDIEMARQVLSSCWFDEERCADGVACLDAYRKEWDDKLGCYKSYPRHDWASHGADAFRAFARNFRPTDQRSSQTVIAGNGGYNVLRGAS